MKKDYYTSVNPRSIFKEPSRIMNSFGRAEGERMPCYRSLRRFLRATQKAAYFDVIAGKLSFGHHTEARLQAEKSIGRIVRVRRRLIRDLNLAGN